MCKTAYLTYVEVAIEEERSIAEFIPTKDLAQRKLHKSRRKTAEAPTAY